MEKAEFIFSFVLFAPQERFCQKKTYQTKNSYSSTFDCWLICGKNYRVFQKTDTQFYFWDNFGNSAPILTILSLLQAEIYGA